MAHKPAATVLKSLSGFATTTIAPPLPRAVRGDVRRIAFCASCMLPKPTRRASVRDQHDPYPRLHHDRPRHARRRGRSPTGCRRNVGDAGGDPGQAGLHGRRHRRPRLPRHVPRHRALRARPLPDDVRHPALDHPPVRRLLHRRGIQRLLPPQHRRRPEGPVRRLRSRHPSRLRQRSSAREGRRRHGRRGDRLHLRHAHAVRRHPARPDVRLHDHERRGAADPRALHRRGRGTGRAAGETRRHHPERHSERVHGAQHLHLSAAAFDAHRLRHLRLHLAEDAEVQLDLDLRLSHAGSRRDGRPRTRLHAGRRRRIRPRRRQRPASTSTPSRRACRSSGRSA